MNPRKFKQGVAGWGNGGKIYKDFLAKFFVMLEEKHALHDVSVLAHSSCLDTEV